MKNNIILCAIVMLLSACNATQDCADVPTDSINYPETFAELMSDIRNSYIISSDSNSYREYSSLHFARDTSKVFKNKDKKRMHDSLAIQDSILDLKVQYLMNKYKTTAPNYYEFRSNGAQKDTVEYIIALRELKDTTCNDRLSGSFSQDYNFYPETFSYEKKYSTWEYDGISHVDIRHDITYRNEVKVPNKKKTDGESTKKLIENFILKYNDVLRTPFEVKYDEGVEIPKYVYATSRFRKDKSEKCYVHGYRYLIPGNAKENEKLLGNLWELFSEHVKNNYSADDAPYTWGFECVSYPGKDDVTGKPVFSSMHLVIPTDSKIGTMFFAGALTVEDGVCLLLINIDSKRFIIPEYWPFIVSVHNDYMEMEEEKYPNWEKSKLKIVGRSKAVTLNPSKPAKGKKK